MKKVFILAVCLLMSSSAVMLVNGANSQSASYVSVATSSQSEFVAKVTAYCYQGSMKISNSNCKVYKEDGNYVVNFGGEWHLVSYSDRDGYSYMFTHSGKTWYFNLYL